MSSNEDYEILLSIFNDNTCVINTKDLLDTPKEFFNFNDLIMFWKQGLIFPSRIQHSNLGYLPDTDSSWSLNPWVGYFAYDSVLGAYQINENITNPIHATLEGSIGLDNPITSVAVHPDHQRFALGSRNGVIAFCSLNEGRIVKTVREGESRTWTLAYSPTGDFLLSGHQNGDLLKWANDKLVKKVTTDDWIRSISFSSNGNQFITSHRVKNEENPGIFQWDIESFQNTSSFMHVPETSWNVKYLIDDTGFVSAGSDMKVTLWSFTSNQMLWSEKKHTGTVIVLARHPVGGIVASGAWTGSIKIWDLESGKDLNTIEAHSNRVYGLAFSPSGNILASGSKDSQICLWQMPTGNVLARFTGHLGWVRALEFIDEDLLISIGSDGFCKIWRLSYSLPKSVPKVIYHSPQEVLNDYRRFMVYDNE